MRGNTETQSEGEMEELKITKKESTQNPKAKPLSFMKYSILQNCKWTTQYIAYTKA